jgi:hypothetical protein
MLTGMLPLVLACFKAPEPIMAPSVTRCENEDDTTLADACWLVTLTDASAPDGEQAFRHCANIRDPILQDQCIVSAASVLSLPLSEQQTLCQRAAWPKWRAECHFLVLEEHAARLDPATYVRACKENTGPMSGSCVDHGLCWWVSGLTGGPETAWFQRSTLEAQITTLQDIGVSTPVSDQLFWALRQRAAGATALEPSEPWEATCIDSLLSAERITWSGDDEAARW